jgi:hypothetical protein
VYWPCRRRLAPMVLLPGRGRDRRVSGSAAGVGLARVFRGRGTGLCQCTVID